MKTLTINIPHTLAIDSKDLTMRLAKRLYGQGKLSVEQTCELANLSKWTFAELLEKYTIPKFNHPASDISEDVANAVNNHF